MAYVEKSRQEFVRVGLAAVTILLLIRAETLVIMPVNKASDAPVRQVRDGLTRRIAHTNDLMMAVIDFTDGPWPDPEPQHHHIHEQVTYVADGDIIFFCEDEEPQRLGKGDIFLVPSNKKHGIQLLSTSATLIDTFNPIREDFL